MSQEPTIAKIDGLAIWLSLQGDAERAVELLGKIKAEHAELLAACKAAASLLLRLGGTNHDPEYSQLRAAIARAEKGETL